MDAESLVPRLFKLLSQKGISLTWRTFAPKYHCIPTQAAGLLHLGQHKSNYQSSRKGEKNISKSRSVNKVSFVIAFSAKTPLTN